MTLPTKNKPKSKPFFQIDSRRLPESEECLNSSLAHSVGELWSCKVAEHFAKKLTHAGL